MNQYLDLLQKIIDHGQDKLDRTNTGVRSLFGYQMRFDLQKGFPLVTTKKVFFRSIVYELLWFLRGDTNISYLSENSVKIWHPWADKNGDLGRVYGAQWRSWQKPDKTSLDQIDQVLSSLKNDPNSRRHVVVAYNPAEIDQMALAPCHALFQFNVTKGKLSCHLYQRSADIFLGVPFNIASYALLTMMISHVLGYENGEFIHSFGDVHLYHNHFEQAKKQLLRKPYELPKIKLNSSITNLDDFDFFDIELIDYKHHDVIKAAISV